MDGISLSTVLLGSLNVTVLVSGFFMKRYIDMQDKINSLVERRLNNVEKFGCVKCISDHNGKAHK